jgi:hypothetical protein
MSMTEEQLKTHFRRIDDELSQMNAWGATFGAIYQHYEIHIPLNTYIVGGIGRTFLRVVQ